jgi:hypothetical protein
MELHELTIIEMAESCGLSEGDVRDLVEIGAVSVDAACLIRLRKATRLQRDFELEPSALGLLVAFLEHIDALEARVRELSARMQGPQRR